MCKLLCLLAMLISYMYQLYMMQAMISQTILMYSEKMPKIRTHNTSLLLPKAVSALIYWCIRCCGLSRDSRVCSLHLNKIKNTVPLKQHDSSLHSPPPATNTLSPLLSFETTLFKTDFGCNVAFSTKEKFYCIEVCLNSFCPN